MRNPALILILILALLCFAAGGCMQTETRLNPGQEPAIYTANRDWVQAQYRQRFDGNEWHYSWRDPNTGAIYLCTDTGPRIRAAELARYGVALPAAQITTTPEPTP